MRRKQKKTRAEASAEQFFPVEQSDVKYAVEKPFKQPELDSLIKVEKEGEIIIKKTPKKKRSAKKRTDKSPSRKAKPKTKRIADYKPPKGKLKADGYELIVTEKPQAALKIASARGFQGKKYWLCAIL